MSLITSIGARLQKVAPAAAAAPATTIQASPVPARTVRAMLEMFSAEKGRLALLRSCRSMFETDTRVRRVITDFAADVVGGGVTINVTEGDPAAAELVQAQAQRLALDSRLDDWLRLTMVDGDSFLEAGVDAQGRVAMVTRKPTLEMRRNSDMFDLFPDPAKAYYWVGNSPVPFAVTHSGYPDDAVPFAAWQVVHARWDHSEGSRYGFPLYGAATQAFKYMTDGEKNMAIKRKLRSGLRLNHKVPGSREEVMAYMELNKDQFDDDFAAFAEYFGNVEINAIQAEGNLDQINDVMHHIRTLSFASPLTLALLGYGQDLNRDVLQEQQKQYEDQVQQVRTWVAAEILRPLWELEWLLAGILPATLKYDVVWRDKKKLNTAQISEAANAGLALLSLGFDIFLIQQMLASYVPQIAEILALQAAAPAAGPAPGAAAEAQARNIAAALDRLEALR